MWTYLTFTPTSSLLSLATNSPHDHQLQSTKGYGHRYYLIGHHCMVCTSWWYWTLSTKTRKTYQPITQQAYCHQYQLPPLHHMIISNVGHNNLWTYPPWATTAHGHQSQMPPTQQLHMIIFNIRHKNMWTYPPLATTALPPQFWKWENCNSTIW